MMDKCKICGTAISDNGDDTCFPCGTRDLLDQPARVERDPDWVELIIGRYKIFFLGRRPFAHGVAPQLVDRIADLWNGRAQASAIKAAAAELIREKCEDPHPDNCAGVCRYYALCKAISRK